MHYKRIFAGAFLTMILLGTFNVSAQVLKFTDIKKITFYYNEGGFWSGGSIYEIVHKNGGWAKHRLRLVRINLDTMINDSTNRLIKKVDKKTVETLVDIYNKADTSLNVKLFGIDYNRLVFTFDSLYPGINENEKEILKKELKNPAMREKALRKSLKNIPMDDKNTCLITFVTVSGEYKMEARSFAHLYEIPWSFKNIKSLDPRLGLIFHEILEDKSYLKIEKTLLYKRMLREAYNDIFKKQLPLRNYN